MPSWHDTVLSRPAAERPLRDVGASVDYSLINSPEQLGQALRMGSESAAGASVTPDSAIRVAAVYRCVDLRASALACLPVHVIGEGADGQVGRKVPGHPLSRLLGSRPNRRHTSYEFRRLLGAHVLLRGNGYALKVRSGRRILELLPLHPDRVRVEEMPDLSIRYHYTRKDGAVTIFDQSDIFHLRDLSTDGVVGHSKIALMREAVGVALQAERFGARMFRNGMGVGGALKHPGRLGDASYDRLRADMESRYAGADNAHRWMILEENMSIEKLGMTSEDMQFLDSRKFQRSEIAMFFGVPPHLIGDVEKTTSWGSGIEQQNLGFLQYTLGGDVQMWEQAIERDLVAEAEAPRIYVKLNVSGFLRAAAKDRAEYFSRALGAGGSPAWMTQNEVRALDDLPPVPGGDELPKPANTAQPAAPSPPEPPPEEGAATQ
jgi:HK97 family phage portal protein